MINEIQRAEELLNGVPFKKEYFFTAYCILVKYYISMDFKPYDVKLKILEWEEKFNHKRYFELDEVIEKYYKDKVKLKGSFEVNISEKDILEIKKRFDNKNKRKVAFAMLCYAKINADKKGCFYMSFPELSQWIGITRENIHNRYLIYLINFEYIEKVKNNKSTFIWDKEKNKNFYKTTRFKINVNFNNNIDGKWILKDNNDFLKLFDEIFIG